MPQDFSEVLDAICSSAAIRADVLTAIGHYPELMESASQRALLLEALLPFGNEALVQDLAVASLASQSLANENRCVVAACNILSSVIAGRRSGLALEGTVESRLLEVASQLTPSDDNLAAGAAQRLIALTSLPYSAPKLVQDEAYKWYTEHRAEENPWFATLSAAPTPSNVAFLCKVLQGSLPQDTRPWLQRRPHAFESMFLSSSVASFIVKYLFAGVNLTGPQYIGAVVGLSVAFIVPIRSLMQSDEDSRFNRRRMREQVDAIAGLAAMRQDLLETSGSDAQDLAVDIERHLQEASQSFFQYREVQAAANLALSQGAIGPKDLWSRVTDKS